MDLLACLQETPPRVPAYFGYDALGSELFESITELPTHYLTRVENALLQRQATHLNRRFDADFSLDYFYPWAR